MTTTPQGPGTWHDAAPEVQVEFDVAVQAWVEATVPLLEEVAGRYGGYVLYGDLAHELFERTGYRTRMLSGNWMGKVLSPVQRATSTDGRPPLTSLVVHADGSVSDGYITHGHLGGFTDDVARQNAAAADRLTCYRLYADDVPDDAQPRMTTAWVDRYGEGPRPHREKSERAAARAAKAAAAARAEEPPAICPSCFMQLPVSGVCGSCD
ncbi:hypothetical protein FH969_10095 [Miniimonas arenae]|uniref:Uncharacterized protein n=1 Tax=Miniimonas arenae TaxID=676201 RepID=A0A5C5BAX2_9MICO|nr:MULTISPECIES: hypothetical protein [Miniimonas]TNU73674.1 hypothetical protein FH969_10095 [Miniimonas arenae]